MEGFARFPGVMPVIISLYHTHTLKSVNVLGSQTKMPVSVSRRISNLSFAKQGIFNSWL